MVLGLREDPREADGSWTGAALNPQSLVVEGSGFRVLGFRVRVQGLGLGLGFRVRVRV